MTKKIIAIASILGVLALGGVSFAVGSAMNKPAVADEDHKAANGILSELKTGKYYLVGGTENEYIEVYNDGTLQLFGFDYFKLVCELNDNYVAGMNEKEFQDFKDSEQDITDFWNARNYYKLSEYSQVIALDDERFKEGQLGGKEGYCLLYSDENTISFDDSHVYKFAE